MNSAYYGLDRSAGDKIALEKALFAANTTLVSIVRDHTEGGADGTTLSLGSHGSVFFEDVDRLQVSDFMWI